MMSHLKHFKKDPKLSKLLHLEIRTLSRDSNVFMSLISSVLGQQLSTAVANVIRQRFLAYYGGKPPTVKQVQQTSVEDLRVLGLSGAKAQYVKNVADFFDENRITSRKLDKLSDDEIIELLTQIKGVGRWTVEMILIFTLGREDVFAVDDLGIQKGMMKLFRWKEMPKGELIKKMKTHSEKWSPYRSFACLYLWHSLDDKNISKTRKSRA